MELGEHTPLLIAIGLGAGVGVLAGSWLMAALSKVLLFAVKLGLLVLVFVAGWWLWAAHQYGLPNRSAQPSYQYPVTENDHGWQPSTSAPSERKTDRWWEE